jgi:Dihydroorotase and related cyclic amidohydrolases
MTKYTKPKSFVLHGEKLLLTNVSVIDVVAGRIDKGQILLQNGRIVDVFHQNYGTIASDLVLDLKGAYVTPGFINAHCHLSMPCTVSGLGGLVRTFKRQIERNAEECIKHGVTTVRDMAALSSLLHNLKVKITDKSVVGPRIITSYILDVSRGYLTSLSAYGLLGDSR